MTFYTCIIILTELMMAAMTVHVFHYTGFTRKQKAWYLLTFGAIMFCAGAEFAVHCGYYDPSYSDILTVFTVLQFSLAPVMAVMFIGALGIPHQFRVAVPYFLINLAVETAAAPHGRIFYFDSGGYCRGQYFYVYGAFYLISLIYLVFGMVRVGKKFQQRDTWTIGMIIVILAAGILPMNVYRLNITYIAVAVSAILCYVYYNDLVQQDIKAELIARQNEISDMQAHIILGLASLIEGRDLETGEHVSRTSAYVKTLAEKAMKEGVYRDEIDEHFISLMYRLAPMHDIGKIVVSDRILKKPGRLTQEEFEQIRRHAAEGGRLVREVLAGVTDQEYLSFASDIAAHHHERWDGKGYPDGLAGIAIPLSARIMAIADVFDALISERCYKRAFPLEAAFEIIREEAGKQFDPLLVEVFLKYKEDFVRKEDPA